MGDLGFAGRSDKSSVNALALAPSLTLRERCECLQGASISFLLGASLLALFMPVPLVAPGAEALFVFGWIYLAGASVGDAFSRALFVGSILIATAAVVALVVLLPESFFGWWLYLLLLGPYVPAVYAPMAIAHAFLFTHLAARFAVGQKPPALIIGVGAITLMTVAITGLLSVPPNPPGFVILLPIGYGLITLGAWRQVRHLRSAVNPELCQGSLS